MIRDNTILLLKQFYIKNYFPLSKVILPILLKTIKSIDCIFTFLVSNKIISFFSKLDEQRGIYFEIMQLVVSNYGGVFFLYDYDGIGRIIKISLLLSIF